MSLYFLSYFLHFSTFLLLLMLYNIELVKGEFMKTLNRTEIKEFTNKYFKIYGYDIRKVSYIVYDDITENLINDHLIYNVKNESN